MDTGPQAEPFIAEPLEDPFRRDTPTPERPPVHAPERPLKPAR